MLFGFGDGDAAPTGKNVDDTKQLAPRTSDKEPFATGTNTLERYGKQHGPLGGLGDKSFADAQPKK